MLSSPDGCNVCRRSESLQSRSATDDSTDDKVPQRRSGVSLNGLPLKIEGHHTAIPVLLDLIQTFARLRNDTAADDDAVVVSNRESGSLTRQAEIRSEGVPASARWLGDLLLE